jgi:TetR/AcrR family transcriptional regulator, transcriptional repressor for nem operon
VARTKEFDPTAALDAALDLFWIRGYEATSMAELVEHLGIGRASLYATFGSKHDLYMKALERYQQARNPNIVALLSQPGPALPAVRALLDAYAARCEADELHKGCMMVNAAAELLPGDAHVARQVESAWDVIETALTSALTRAVAQGELPADRDPAALARFLLVVLQGLQVVSKARPNGRRMRDAVAQAVKILE